MFSGKQLRLILLMVAATTLLGCSENQTPPLDQASRPGDKLSLTGTGEVTAHPDRFHLHATASREGDDVPRMQQEVNAEIRTALELSERLELDDDDVEAMSIRIQPQWQWQPERELIGYRVARDLKLTVSNMEAYARLVSELTELGFREINDAGHSISAPEIYHDEALKNALADARRQAELLAEESQRQLGAIRSMEVMSSGSATPRPMMARAVADEAESFRPGTRTITREIHVTFSLE